MNQLCKSCQAPVAEIFYFCPNCGKKIKEPPYRFSWGATIAIILESILLPPFGLIPGIRYLRKNDITAQIIGVIAIGLTIISTVILIMFTKNLIDSTVKTYNDTLNFQGAINNPSGDIMNQIETLENANQ